MGVLTEDMTRLRDEVDGLRRARGNLSKELVRNAKKRRNAVAVMERGFHKTHAEMAAKTRRELIAFVSGLKTNVSKAPNGLTYELKSVAFHNVKDKLVPKETMAITMINPEELKEHSFFESHCWSKLKAIVFCAVMWHGKNSEHGELVKVASLDFAEDDELILEIKAD